MGHIPPASVQRRAAVDETEVEQVLRLGFVRGVRGGRRDSWLDHHLRSRARPVRLDGCTALTSMMGTSAVAC